MQDFLNTLSQFVEEVKNAPEGQRNSTLNKTANKAMIALEAFIPEKPEWMSDILYTATKNSMRNLALFSLADAAYLIGMNGDEVYAVCGNAISNFGEKQ